MEVRPLPAAEHLAFVQAQSLAPGSVVTFAQCPSWALVKSEWRSQGLGFFRGRTLVGTALVLYRPLPWVRASLAYVPEGPVIDWERNDPAEISASLVAHARSAGAFAVKLGLPQVLRTWSADTVKRGLADPAVSRLRDLPPDATEPGAAVLADRLRILGWRQYEAPAAGFGGTMQPRYGFRLPLAGRTSEQVLAGFSQQWRRNVRKAERAGVRVELGDRSDLATFHELLVETGLRDGFTPRGLSYYERMWDALTAEDPARLRLYLARQGGNLHAATLTSQVGGYVGYLYGASSTAGRDLRPSNAIQWRTISDALEAGATVYDLRGVSDSLADTDPLAGLVRFKLGTGGNVVENLGEWDFPLRPLVHRAVTRYLSRR